jgi:hypothetical protein
MGNDTIINVSVKFFFAFEFDIYTLSFNVPHNGIFISITEVYYILIRILSHDFL